MFFVTRWIGIDKSGSTKVAGGSCVAPAPRHLHPAAFGVIRCELAAAVLRPLALARCATRGGGEVRMACGIKFCIRCAQSRNNDQIRSNLANRANSVYGANSANSDHLWLDSQRRFRDRQPFLPSNQPGAHVPLTCGPPLPLIQPPRG